LHDVLKTGINPNVDIKTHGELTLVDWVWIFGTLIFVALIWFCIVLLARGANQLATTQAQAVLAPESAAGLQALSESDPAQHAQSVTAMTQREPQYLAFVSPSVDSSSKLPSQPTKRTKSRGSTDKLATTNPKSIKAIREHQRKLVRTRFTNHRRSTVDVSRRSGRFKKGAPRSLKMLIAMWRQTSKTSKLALNESH
jgi:DNA-binding transcriptional regulator YiaG